MYSKVNLWCTGIKDRMLHMSEIALIMGALTLITPGTLQEYRYYQMLPMGVINDRNNPPTLHTK